MHDTNDRSHLRARASGEPHYESRRNGRHFAQGAGPLRHAMSVSAVVIVIASLLVCACADASADASSAANSATGASGAASAANVAVPAGVSAANVAAPAGSSATGITAQNPGDAAASQPASSALPTLPALEAAKAHQLAEEQQVAARVPAASGMNVTRTRPLTLRDSGIDGSMMFARDVDFRLTGDIGFLIHRMAATLTPTRAGNPIVFDDPNSVTINVHRGEVTLDAAKLTAIFNRYLFQYQGSPLRNMRVEPQQGQLRITGEMQRDGWVPIALTGTLAMRNSTELVFHADHTEVAGVAADRLMRAAHVRMADLLKVNTPIAQLDGDNVVMQVAKLTPPPALRMTITRVDTSPAGVRFTLDDGTLPDVAFPATMPARGMLLEGGDVKFMRSIPMNIEMAITPLDTGTSGAPFVLDLYHYREQMAAGYFTFDENGALDVHLPSYTTLPGAARDAAQTAQTGSAAARYNDSYIRAQQAALAVAREQWRRIPVSLRGTPMSGVTLYDERHSPGGIPLIHVQNVDFYVSGRIGFHVRTLDAQLVPKKPGQPVDLDDPNQYDIHILGGEVIEPWPAMAALFNDYLLDYTPRSLNDMQLTPADGGLDVTGGIKLWNHFPGVWLPTKMHGTLAVRDERHLVYTPESVSVLGVPQAGMLRALNIPLASLTPFARKGVKLEGNELVFDQYTVFPPPVLQGRLEGATVTNEGLVLKFKRQMGVAVAHPPAGAGGSYVWIESGDIKMYNSLVVNGHTLIRDTANSDPMHFDLYAYRRDVAKGTVRMAEDGSLTVDVAARK